MTNSPGVAHTSQTVNVTNVVKAPTGLPQDITTMSDHDLISYINPSCFDQGAGFELPESTYFQNN